MWTGPVSASGADSSEMDSISEFRNPGRVTGRISAKSWATSLSLSVAVIVRSPAVIVMGVPAFGDA